jgi:glucan phosphoethanolaminetransferase (alkaline phosphatase superfamily)
MTTLKACIAVICLTIFILRTRDIMKLPKSKGNQKVRESKIIFAYASLLFAITVALDINTVYDTVDAALGGQNYANLIMRACVYALFFILGVVTARAFNSMLALWLIKGHPGQIAFAIATSATIISHMLGAYSTSNPYGTPAGCVYSLIWQLYIAYIGICLLTALLPAATTPGGSSLRRYSAAITSMGYLLIIVYPFIRIARELFGYQEWFTDAIKMGTVTFIVIGSTIPWIARKWEQRKNLQPAAT